MQVWARPNATMPALLPRHEGCKCGCVYTLARNNTYPARIWTPFSSGQGEHTGGHGNHCNKTSLATIWEVHMHLPLLVCKHYVNSGTTAEVLMYYLSCRLNYSLWFILVMSAIISTNRGTSLHCWVECHLGLSVGPQDPSPHGPVQYPLNWSYNLSYCIIRHLISAFIASSHIWCGSWVRSLSVSGGISRLHEFYSAFAIFRGCLMPSTCFAFRTSKSTCLFLLVLCYLWSLKPRCLSYSPVLTAAQECSMHELKESK